ncbi:MULTISPECIES: hypothetical protein [unclassified Ruegeria]|uniref:hypothetical protein n=1 Tax=unclassified Ruegeria TaxID=2625375 RepID=UPI001489181D|nr:MULTISPECIES: hypothetical protein [unclassified Ruegeria]
MESDLWASMGGMVCRDPARDGPDDERYLSKGRRLWPTGASTEPVQMMGKDHRTPRILLR